MTADVQHVVATAGHVDHGKSSLVRALTGMEPDRYEEERRRGLTIDLGYAWCDLPTGETVAFVDVPGHARFTGTMLAGVGPVPAVLLVVAADAGWSRQTTEHVAALEALGVWHGVVAVTRSDLADPTPTARDVATRLARTRLAGSEVVAVSSLTGQGLPELQAALGRTVRALPPPTSTGRVRLWVDRAFSIRGSGTVVTGTLAAGQLRVGDELEVQPGGHRGRVRALQSLQVPAERVEAVARVAVNLRGVDRDDVQRGAALCTPGEWRTTTSVDVRLDLAQPDALDVDAPAAEARTAADLPRELVLHVGSAGVPVSVRPFDASTARLALQTPLPLQIGDAGVLRDPGAQAVAAGVVVLDPAPPALRRRGAGARRAEQLIGMDARPDPLGEVRRRGPQRRADLAALGVLPVDAAVPDGLVEVGGVLATPVTVEEWRTALGAAVDAHAAEHPLDGGLPREAARQLLRLPDLRVLEALVTTPGLQDTSGRLHRPGATTRLAPEAAAALDALRTSLEGEPFRAPEAHDLPRLGLTPPVLAALDRAGAVLRLPGGVVLLAEAEEEAVRRLVDLPPPFTTSQARSALGTTRRVAVPLLEHLDARRRTRRVDASTRTVVRP